MAQRRSRRSQRPPKVTSARRPAAYYTPDSLVQLLLKETLDPVIDRKVAENPNNPEALLALKVIDPACGSGHFLVAAANHIARRLADLRHAGAPTRTQHRHELREVARHCIHGVDRNPMAVELCKVALWIEVLEPGRPLTFLDSHICCGDT
jgi:type I restriction-modification system DNA methylase subunit